MCMRRPLGGARAIRRDSGRGGFRQGFWRGGNSVALWYTVALWDVKKTFRRPASRASRFEPGATSDRKKTFSYGMYTYSDDFAPSRGRSKL